MIRALGIFAVTYALMNTWHSTFARIDRPTAALSRSAVSGQMS